MYLRIISEKNTAIIEMAGAAGLPLVPEKLRNPMETTTYGVGQVIRDAIACGCRKLIIGIGGSATNDGGAGMLQALDYQLLDDAGNPIPQKGPACPGFARSARRTGCRSFPGASFWWPAT